MNPSIIFIEIAIMLLGFTVLVSGMLFIKPLTFISDYPPEIQAEYYRSQHKETAKETLTKLMVLKKLIAVVVFLFVFAWMLHLAGAKTFWQGVGLTWMYMLSVFAWDTFFLDWVLFANIKRVRLSGTEYMEREYHQKWFHVKVCLPVVPFAILAGFPDFAAPELQTENPRAAAGAGYPGMSEVFAVSFRGLYFPAADPVDNCERTEANRFQP